MDRYIVRQTDLCLVCVYVHVLLICLMVIMLQLVVAGLAHAVNL